MLAVRIDAATVEHRSRSFETPIFSLDFSLQGIPSAGIPVVWQP
tara:strand:- start:4008 stop:4139 length:132 start_codon:yes stop_codon:yes gene_type:complete